jgi:hypothetical protein
VHEFDGREGGSILISLTYNEPTGTGKTTAHTDTYNDRFVKLVPNEQVVKQHAKAWNRSSHVSHPFENPLVWSGQTGWSHTLKHFCCILFWSLFLNIQHPEDSLLLLIAL